MLRDWVWKNKHLKCHCFLNFLYHKKGHKQVLLWYEKTFFQVVAWRNSVLSVQILKEWTFNCETWCLFDLYCSGRQVLSHIKSEVYRTELTFISHKLKLKMIIRYYLAEHQVSYNTSITWPKSGTNYGLFNIYF